MELLLNGLLKSGARRDRLEAKIFGGAKTVRGLADVGSRNIAFARKFLQDEGITIVSSSVGGEQGRRVHYWPVSGRARQSLVVGRQVFEEAPRRFTIPETTNNGELELF